MATPPRDLREAALKSAEDALYDVRQSFELADSHRITGSWANERPAVQATRDAIARVTEHLTTLRGLL